MNTKSTTYYIYLPWLIVSLLIGICHSVAYAGHSPEVEKDSIALYDRLIGEGQWIAALDRINGFISSHDEESRCRELAEAHMLAGFIYMGFYDYINAAENFNACMHIAESSHDKYISMRAAANACMSYCCLGNETEARKALAVARQSCPDKREPYSRFVIDMGHAFVERYFGSRDKAVAILKRNLEMTRNGNVHPDKAVNALSELTELYEGGEQPDSLRKYLDMYYSEAMRLNQNHLIVDCMRIYMNHFIQKGDLDSAIYYQQRYFILKDSILDIRNFMATAGMHTQILKKKDRTTILRQNSLISLQRSLMIVLILFLITLCGGTAILIIQKRRLNRAYQSLWEKNQTLETPAEEKVVTTETEAGPEHKGNPELADKILAVMEDAEVWTDPEFSLQKLAELTGSNTRYVSATVNDTFGKNFRSFINEYRVKAAMRLMADQDNYSRLTIQSIGQSVGFKSSTNFIEAFRRHTGLTPSVYLKITVQNQKS